MTGQGSLELYPVTLLTKCQCLSVHDLPQHKFFGGIADVAYFLHPGPPVIGFELFRDAAFLFHPVNNRVQHVVRLFVDLKQVRLQGTV